MLFTLEQLGMLDAPAEVEFDNITSLAAELLGVPMAHVSITDLAKKRVFYKSQFGHPDALATGRELPMEQTYCQHVPLTQDMVVINDSRSDELVSGTPAQVEGPLAYLGIPINAPEGHVIGGLCLMQGEPRDWSDADIRIATRLAACATDLIALKSAMLASEQLRQEQHQFTYSVSHDLQSPSNTLHMILNELTHECEDNTNADIQTLLLEGLSTVTRMKRQVEDVLEYSRAADTNEAIELISLNSLFPEVLNILDLEIKETNASISCDDLPEIYGYRKQIRSLLTSLISNALKFQPLHRKPIIDIKASQNEITGEHKITIKDNGIGIALEDQTSIFELFTRLHLREKYIGAGIGLALCRRVANNHRGNITVKSDGITGSVFTVSLPGHKP